MKILLLLLPVLGACVGPPPLLLQPGLRGDVRATLGAIAPEARLSLWVADVDGREILAIEADRRLPAASIVKVLILVEAHARALRGDFHWDARHVLEETEQVAGSGSLQRSRPGTEWSHRQLARKMMVESDNTASNILLRRLGMARVNERAASLGMRVTRIERRFMDLEARDRGRDNWATAREMGRLMLSIYRGEILTPDTCGEMAGLMEQAHHGGISAGVPEGIRVGHKGGWLPGLRHDVGWVRAHERPYVVAILLEGAIERREGDRGQRAIEAISGLIYRSLQPVITN